MRKIQLLALATFLAGCAQSGPDAPRWGSSSWCDSPQAALDKSGRCGAGGAPAEAVPVAYAPPQPTQVAPEGREPMPLSATAGDADRSEAERLVLSQPAGWYTVQLFADPSEARLQRFAREHGLSPRLHVRTERDGQTWHVLLLEVYPSLAEARAGLEEVAGRLPTQPWIRKLGGLQGLIR